MTRRGSTQGRDPGMIEAGAVLAPVKDGRCAPLRGGLRPSLTAAARGAPGWRRPGRGNGSSAEQGNWEKELAKLSAIKERKDVGFGRTEGWSLGHAATGLP